jgi:hypothetical protein
MDSPYLAFWFFPTTVETPLLSLDVRHLTGFVGQVAISPNHLRIGHLSLLSTARSMVFHLHFPMSVRLEPGMGFD